VLVENAACLRAAAAGIGRGGMRELVVSRNEFVDHHMAASWRILLATIHFPILDGWLLSSNNTTYVLLQVAAFKWSQPFCCTQSRLPL
jgi:hypothetical protein